jgi:hypothetical protein
MYYIICYHRSEIIVKLELMEKLNTQPYLDSILILQIGDVVYIKIEYCITVVKEDDHNYRM